MKTGNERGINCCVRVLTLPKTPEYFPVTPEDKRCIFMTVHSLNYLLLDEAKFSNLEVGAYVLLQIRNELCGS